jgi:site-specific DNA-methyltransferase (adenine-specific)
MEQVYRVTKGTVIVFCGIGQVSPIYNFFRDKDNGTVRQLLWVKTNPSPMNGDSVYLSGVENAVWYRKPNSTFNAHRKNTVFEYSSRTSKLHPTEKNHKLIAELIRDNSNEGDLILDPCCGSGSHCLVAKENNRNFIGIELYKDYYEIATKRLKQPIQKKLLGFG